MTPKSGTDQSLGCVVMAAIATADQMRADGASQVECLDVVEQVLRYGFPHGRPWKYLCQSCQDTGLDMRVCQRGDRCNGVSTRTDGPKERPGKYRRLCAVDTAGDYTHEYGVPCFCSLGQKFRDHPPSAEDFTSAGKTSKPMTRWGR